MEMTVTGQPLAAPRQKNQQKQHATTHMHYTPHNIASVAADAAASVQASTKAAGGPMNDARAKTVLKEAVDAVVNSFAKHTHGSGRGSLVILVTFGIFPPVHLSNICVCIQNLCIF